MVVTCLQMDGDATFYTFIIKATKFPCLTQCGVRVAFGESLVPGFRSLPFGDTNKSAADSVQAISSAAVVMNIFFICN